MSSKHTSLVILAGDTASAPQPVSDFGVEMFVGGLPARGIVKLYGSPDGAAGRYVLAWAGSLARLNSFRGKFSHIKAVRDSSSVPDEITVDVSSEASGDSFSLFDQNFDKSVTTVDDVFTLAFSYPAALDGTYQFSLFVTATRTADKLIFASTGGGAFKRIAGVCSGMGAGDGYIRGSEQDAGVSVYGTRLVGDGSNMRFEVKGYVAETFVWRLRLSIGVPVP